MNDSSLPSSDPENALGGAGSRLPDAAVVDGSAGKVSGARSPLLRRLLSRQLVLYLIIGGAAAAIDIGGFALLYVGFGWGALASHSVSVPTSGVFSFACNAWLNFRKTDRLFYRALSFAIVVLLGYLLGAGIIRLVEALTPFGGGVGKIVSLPFVVAFQYYLNSRVSFRG